MALTVPSDPGSGDSILEWAKKIGALLRKILALLAARPSPRPISRGGSSSAEPLKIAFGYYPAPYLGGGDVPDDQGLRIQLYPGVINADVVPSNMGSVFTLENNDTNFLVCTTSQTAEGEVTSATLGVVTALAPDSAGTLDVAPATSTRALWRFTTAGLQITDAVPQRIGGLDVGARIIDRECDSVRLCMVWGGTQIIG